MGKLGNLQGQLPLLLMMSPDEPARQQTGVLHVSHLVLLPKTRAGEEGFNVLEVLLHSVHEIKSACLEILMVKMGGHTNI